MVLGEVSNAPPGFTATGWTLSASTGVAPWTTLATMPIPRRGAAAVAASGKVYVLGGRNFTGQNPGVMVLTVDEYDPQTNTWTMRQAMMATGRTYHAAAAVNGRIFVVGGRASDLNQPLDSVEEYDPVADAWYSRSPMHTPRSFLAVAVVGGRIFALGGDTSGGSTLSSVEEYDPLTDAWEDRTPMLLPRRDFGAATANGKVYAIGTGIEEYDPATDSWAWKTSWSVAPGIEVTSANGKGYLVSAATSGPLFEYDPITNIITELPGSPTPRYEAAVTSLDDKLYMLGGIGYGSFPYSNIALATAERFDFAAFRTLYVHRKN